MLSGATGVSAPSTTAVSAVPANYDQYLRDIAWVCFFFLYAAMYLLFNQALAVMESSCNQERHAGIVIMARREMEAEDRNQEVHHVTSSLFCTIY